MDRRQYLRAVSVVGIAGAAGCLGDGGDGSGGSGGNSDGSGSGGGSGGSGGSGGGGPEPVVEEACSPPNGSPQVLLPDPSSTEILLSETVDSGVDLSTDDWIGGRYRTTDDNGTYDVVIARYETPAAAQRNVQTVAAAGQNLGSRQETVALGRYVIRVDGTVAEEVPDMLAMTGAVTDECAEALIGGTVDRSLGSESDYLGKRTPTPTPTPRPEAQFDFRDEFSGSELDMSQWRVTTPFTTKGDPFVELRDVAAAPGDGRVAHMQSNEYDDIGIGSKTKFDWSTNWRLTATLRPQVVDREAVSDYENVGWVKIGRSGERNFYDETPHLHVRPFGTDALNYRFMIATEHQSDDDSPTFEYTVEDEAPFFNFEFIHDGDRRYQYRVWPVGESEPEPKARTDSEKASREVRELWVSHFGGKSASPHALQLANIRLESL